MFSEVTCNRFTYSVWRLYLPLVSYHLWLCSLTNKIQVEICLDIYETQETLYHCTCTSVVCCASTCWRWKENVANESFSWMRRLTTIWAVITHYALPLEDFWTNPLIIHVVGEAPSVSQTGYKAYGCSPWAMITLSHIRDTNWHLLRFVTFMRMMPRRLSHMIG